MDILARVSRGDGKIDSEYEGTLEHFAGDGMMIFFNDPVPVADAAERAVRMALAMRERVKELTVKWRKLGHDLDFGVGIAQGYATIGAIGYRRTLGVRRDRQRAQSGGASMRRSEAGRDFDSAALTRRGGRVGRGRSLSAS